jgi:hypothetical protein
MAGVVRMKILTCAVLSWFVVAQLPPSQPPSPSSAKSGPDQKAHSNHESPPTSENQTLAAAGPSALDQGDSEARNRPHQDETQPAEKDTTGNGRSWFKTFVEQPWWPAVNAVLLTVFNGILAFVAIRQWLNFRQQERHTQQELRAYVCLDLPTSRYDRLEHESHKFVLSIKNSGATPAHDVKFCCGTLFKDFPYRGNFPLDEPTNCFVLPPNAHTAQNVTMNLRTGDSALIDDAKKILYAYGRIEYFDVFGKAHWAEFRIQVSGGTSQPIISPAGNTASK